MIQNIWCVLCKVSIDNKASHNLTLVECLEKLAVSVSPEMVETPFQIQVNYTVATFWHNYDDDNPSTAEIALSVEAPDGEKLGEGMTIKAAFMPGGYFKALFQINRLELRGPGRYLFIIRSKEEGKKRWKHIATIPLTVAYNLSDEIAVIQVPIPQRVVR